MFWFASTHTTNLTLFENIENAFFNLTSWNLFIKYESFGPRPSIDSGQPVDQGHDVKVDLCQVFHVYDVKNLARRDCQDYLTWNFYLGPRSGEGLDLAIPFLVCCDTFNSVKIHVNNNSVKSHVNKNAAKHMVPVRHQEPPTPINLKKETSRNPSSENQPSSYASMVNKNIVNFVIGQGLKNTMLIKTKIKTVFSISSFFKVIILIP